MVDHVCRLMVLTLSFALGGCAIHPLPTDYAGVATTDIVRQVRCEARFAVANNIVQWLGGNNRSNVEKEIAKKFSVKPTEEVKWSTSDFPGFMEDTWSDRAIIEKFIKSAVAYDFAFDMAETNNLGATFDFLGILKHTTGSAALMAGADRKRQNIRTFTITDTFEGLLNIQNPAEYCKPYVAAKNIIYPVTGTIGLGEMVFTFANLTLFSNLGGVEHKGPPTMTDKLVFTTTLSGSLTPKIIFAQAFRGAQIADASLVVEASRSDTHQVIVALALPPPPDAKIEQPSTGTFITSRGSQAEIIAAQAINQVIFRFELGRSAALTSTTN